MAAPAPHRCWRHAQVNPRASNKGDKIKVDRVLAEARPASYDAIVLPGGVAAEDLSRAHAKVELARTAAFAAGPALGGVLVGGTGATAAFAWASALSLCAVLLLSGVREPPRATARRRQLLHEIREGASFVWGHALLLPVFVTQFIFNVAFFILYAAFVPHALNWLRPPASAVGSILVSK